MSKVIGKSWLLLSGSLASVMYILAVILGGLLWPGYSHLRQAISELTMASAPNQWIMQPMFLVYNLLALVFGVSLVISCRDKLMKIAGILLSVVAVSGVLMLFFTQDPLNASLTFRGLMHLILAGIAAVGTIAAILVGGSGAVKEGAPTTLKRFSILAGSVVTISGGLTPVAINMFTNYFGVFERVTILSFIIWMFVFSFVMYQVVRSR